MTVLEAVKDLKYNSDGLIPVITQDARSGEVLMLAWANTEALELTLSTKEGTYYSRSRQELWVKGKTSGHTQKVLAVRYDCDSDAVLYLVEQQGPACHTGKQSCFHNPLMEEEGHTQLGFVVSEVYKTILDRIEHQPEGSYVTTMHRAGLDRILKKIPEEAGEVLLAAKNTDPQELATETADLLFHTLFVMAELGVKPEDIAGVLSKRMGKSGLRGPKPVG